MSIARKFTVYVKRLDTIYEVEFVSYMSQDSAERRALVAIGMKFQDFDTEMEVVHTKAIPYENGRFTGMKEFFVTNVPTLIRDGESKTVSIRWLGEHHREVRSFSIKSNFGKGGVVLTANLENGVFLAPFADPATAHKFIHRPIWYGLTISWYSYPRTIPFELGKRAHAKKDQ